MSEYVLRKEKGLYEIGDNSGYYTSFAPIGNRLRRHSDNNDDADIDDIADHDTDNDNTPDDDRN